METAIVYNTKVWRDRCKKFREENPECINCGKESHINIFRKQWLKESFKEYKDKEDILDNIENFFEDALPVCEECIQDNHSHFYDRLKPSEFEDEWYSHTDW